MHHLTGQEKLFIENINTLYVDHVKQRLSEFFIHTSRTLRKA